MNSYVIKIFNGANILIFDEIIKAKDENEAMLQVINDNIICTGDTIKIEEI